MPTGCPGVWTRCRRTLDLPRGGGRSARLCAWVALFVTCATGILSAQTNDPVIRMQPVGGAAALGETFAFSVAADGNPPPVYRWLFNGAPIPGATNSSLLLTNLQTTESGSYTVSVTNMAGSVVSEMADLRVVTTAPRVVWVKDVAPVGSAAADVPLVLAANGRETSVQFSLLFDTNAFNSPIYQWASGNDVTIVSSNEAEGRIGFEISRPFPGLFPAGQQPLGVIRFGLTGTNTSVLDGRLAFTNDPVAIQAVDTNGLGMLLSAAVVAQVHAHPTQPELNLQTGLFEQEMQIANPSATLFLDLPVYIPWLGVDTSSNEISLFNGSGMANVDLDGDGVVEPAAVITVSNLPPGSVQVFTNGFYVTDHATAPVADYYVGIGGTPGIPMPSTTVPLRITRAQQDESGFALEWCTRPGRTYSVNYAARLMDLFDPDRIMTSTNTVTGTGSPARWLDDPRSETNRFYQVTESQ